jgi:hypothetical protein
MVDLFSTQDGVVSFSPLDPVQSLAILTVEFETKLKKQTTTGANHTLGCPDAGLVFIRRAIKPFLSDVSDFDFDVDFVHNL